MLFFKDAIFWIINGVTKNKNYYYLLLRPQKANFWTFFWTAFEVFFGPPFSKWWPKVTKFEAISPLIAVSNSKNIPLGRRSSAGESRPSRWNVQKTKGLEAWLKRRCQIYLNRRFSIKILMLRSNTAHLQSADKSAEPPQEQRPRRRVKRKRGRLPSSSFSYPMMSYFRTSFCGT